MPRRPSGKRHTNPDGTVTVSAKAANGEGSIYPDSRGMYRATYLDADGKRRTVSGRTKAIAAERRDARLAEIAADAPTGALGSSPTVGAVAAWWLENVAAANVRPGTLHTYGRDVRRIVDGLGSVPIADLDVERVRAWVAQVRRSVSAATATNTRARLRQIADEAVELGYLSANPVPRVKRPKAGAGERKAKRRLTPDEVRRLLGVLDGTRRFDAGIAMLYTSGVRANETLGLAWPDLDLEAATATIVRGCTYTPHIGPQLDATKTVGTAGVHHLSPTVIRLLRKRQEVQEAERAKGGDAWRQAMYEGAPIMLVFASPLGGLPLRQSLYAALTAALKRADIDPHRVGTHTGRRSVITAMWQDGMSLEDIARHVGHSSSETTAGYVVDLGERPRQSAARAARLLDPATDEGD